jgi:hypothetical protein
MHRRRKDNLGRSQRLTKAEPVLYATELPREEPPPPLTLLLLLILLLLLTLLLLLLLLLLLPLGTSSTTGDGQQLSQ